MNFDPRTPFAWLGRIFRFSRPGGRRFFTEWFAIGSLGLATILITSVGHLATGAGWFVYDRLLRLQSCPVSPDIVILEIDNESIARLGRWPWPRDVHARLIGALAKARPAAVVYDVLFTEPSEHDAALAKAMAAVPTYLPVLLSPEARDGSRVTQAPVAPLAKASAALGHINLEVDPDGIVRSVALTEHDGQTPWPELVVPVFEAIRHGTVKIAPPLQGSPSAIDPARSSDTDTRVLIPFSSRFSASYPRVSFARVLNGEVPPEMLRGKIVFIGATAAGLYDLFATPASGELGPMPGVLVHANLLDTLLTAREIYLVGGLALFLASILPFGAMLAGFLVLSPRRSLLLTGLLCVAMATISAALLHTVHIWLSPVPAIAGMVVVYLLWNWRRLEMTMSYLRGALQQLADEPCLLPEASSPPPEFAGDVLEQHIALMSRASERVKDMRRFVWDSLNGVPEPILVSDRRGVVLLANQAARTHFLALGAPSPDGRTLCSALSGLELVKTVDETPGIDAYARANWPTLLDPRRPGHESILECGVEVRDRNERDHLLRYAKCRNAQGEITGWIAGLVNVTALHAAERQREEALRWLSHDMRSPQASILALVEVEQARADSDRVRDVLTRVERYAQRTLKLSDDFVQLARAESQVYVFEPVNFPDLVIDASDEVWPQARAKRIEFDMQFLGHEHWVRVDRSLMTRTLVNILNNAIKYSPANTRVACTVETKEQTPSRVQCTIRDQGYGITPQAQTHLFERFRRFRTPAQPQVSGTGLGMAFVQTVVARHGGEVSVESQIGKGTTLIVSLPLSSEPAA
ncbi:CHASE2 domain-containing protein [Trinickia fusca]|uniref:histidine kinase n=1 Tax=Trinickia fusca TaxID=2419777 RepID=A0A494XB52_9BURK|nr:CHASE2 domain-containing protein [Trinickia fusca]RKP46871.1 CHASE2 domain-containing protein [Trinickia fusca]